MPPRVVNFEDENGEDEAGAVREAMQNVAKLVWDRKDLTFIFNRFEINLGAAGVKKNYTKFQILSNCIPKEIQDEVKSLLCMQQTEFPNNDAYKQLKAEILRIFGPEPEEAVDRALNRVLVGKPSQLARHLVDDLCKKKLDCECCPVIVTALWKRHLRFSWWQRK